MAFWECYQRIQPFSFGQPALYVFPIFQTAKDPLLSADAIMRCCLKNLRKISVAMGIFLCYNNQKSISGERNV